jgi:DNA-3-methyladenine glycosylase II
MRCFEPRCEATTVRCRTARWPVLDRHDVSLTGDLALRRAIEREYGFDHLPTDDEMLQLADRWRPYRSLAVSYLFASEYDGQP